MSFQKAINILTQGGVIGLPTETVYGLAGDATQSVALAKIYAFKNRPQFNPLIVHGHSIEQLQEYGMLSDVALKFAEAFWPGPLTLVVPRTKNCPADLLVSAGMDTIALRIPGHTLAREFLKAYGQPLAAPSANISNQLSSTSKAMVLSYFPDLYVLEGGACEVGLESTILGCAGDHVTLLRPGGTSQEDLEKVMGSPLSQTKGDVILAPGMMKKHYAPRTLLRLDALEKKDDELLLGFGHIPHADLNLSEQGDLIEAASNLFSMLHILDKQALEKGMTSIAVSPIPNHDLGLAMNDRLLRAAAA